MGNEQVNRASKDQLRKAAKDLRQQANNLKTQIDAIYAKLEIVNKQLSEIYEQDKKHRELSAAKRKELSLKHTVCPTCFRPL